MIVMEMVVEEVVEGQYMYQSVNHNPPEKFSMKYSFRFCFLRLAALKTHTSTRPCGPPTLFLLFALPMAC